MKKITFILLSLIFNLFYTQGFELNPVVPDTHLGVNMTVASPNETRLLRFADFPNVDYIGKTDISIPIYEINLDGLKIPIALSYDTKGNKVMDVASDVGLGWTLLAGGNINLEQNDIYDFLRDFNQKYMQGPTEWQGRWDVWRAIRTGWFASNYTITGMSPYEPISTSKFTDAAPDFYIVQAPGLNDKFYLKGGGGLDQYMMESLINYKSKFPNPLIASNSLNCVDTNQIFPQPQSFLFNSYERVCRFDHFDILNDLGFTYTFNNAKLAHNNSYVRASFLAQPVAENYPRFPYSWGLSKIQSPYSLNNKVEFEYENFDNNTFDGTLNISSPVNKGNINITENVTLQNNTSVYGAIFYPNQSNEILNVSRLFNSNRVKKITFKEGTINFTYGSSRQDYDGNILSEVKVTDKNGNPIKNVIFHYSYFQPKNTNCVEGKECLRLKLDSIYDSTIKESYAFNYGTNSQDVLFPPRHSYETDYIGYYNNNGTPFKYTIFDNVTIDVGGQPNVIHGYGFNTNPTPSPNPYNLMDYTTKIYFYPHINKDFFLPFKLSNKTEESTFGTLNRTPNSNSLLGLLTKIIYPTGGSLDLTYENDRFSYEGGEYLLGSARIQKLKLKDKNGTTTKEETFEYVGDNGASSGQINFLKPPANILTGDTGGSFFYSNSSIVGYSKVTKKINGKGKTSFYFTNFNDESDILETITPPTFNNVGTINFIKYFKYPSVYIQSRDLNRGKILKEEIFNESGFKTLEKSYGYNESTIPLLTTNRKIYEDLSNSNGLNFIEHTAKNTLIKYSKLNTSITKQVFFVDNSKTLDVTSITYDTEKNTLKSKLNMSSDLTSSKTTYSYSYDFPSNNSLVNLYNHNIIKPVLTESYYNEKLVSKEETLYTNNALKPSSVISYDVGNPSNSNIEINYDQYDSQGNILQYTTKSGITTAVIWGYNNTQPIAEIEGATYSQVSSLASAIITASDVDASQVPNNDESALLTALDNFRKDGAMVNFRITTYTCDPLIGVRSVTPPNGIRENYIYDTEGRLKEVRDVTGRILKENKYNYKH